MENNDHKSPILSGNDGHGGGHVCHKCGWAFPNHHPSSKQRRAHKRICGTVEGYRLDNDARDKTRVEGDVGELNSGDELKTPKSEKVVERTISRRSSSGVGSKSGRSTRSEEDVFTDADTEFNDSSGTVTGETSDGVIQRYYSLQNGNELDNMEPADENSAGTGKKQTFQRVEGETDNLGAVVGPQDLISTSPLVSAAVALTSENTVDQNAIQSSEPSREPDIVSERVKEIISSKDESDTRTSFNAMPKEVAEEVSVVKDASDEVKGVSDPVLDSGSAGGLMETDKFNDVDFSDKDKIQSCSQVNSAGNLEYSSALQIQDNDPGNSNITKPDLIQECDLEIGANENLGHNAGYLNLSEVTDSTGESVEYSKANGVDDAGSVINLIKPGDYDRVYSEDVAVCSTVDKHEDNKNFDNEQNIIREPEKSDANSCNVDINVSSSEAIKDLKGIDSEENDIFTEEKKPITSLENIFVEGVSIDAGQIQETTPNDDFNVKDDGERFTVMDNDSSEVPANELAVRNSMSFKPIVDEVPSQDLVLINTLNKSGISNVDNTFEAANLKVKEMSGGVVENVSSEIDRNAAPGVVEKISESRATLITDDYLNVQCGGELESICNNAQGEGFVDDNVTDAIVISDDHLNLTSKLEGDENAVYSCQSLAVVNHDSIGKLTEKSSCSTEGVEVINQHVTIPAIDTIVDSGSQADSLDGNWGSVSVLSAISDAQFTADTTGSNHPLVLEGEESPVIVPKPVMDNQPSEKQIPVETEVGIERLERVSEIQTSKEEQLINSTDVANKPEQGNKDKEIIAKVANWDSGSSQRTPLKTLLGEAIARSRAESPIHHNQSSTSTSTPVPLASVIPGTNNGLKEKSETVVLKSDHHDMEAAQEEMGKEWDSPAKYPVKIRSEKRRSKSKPYWAPFLCCSSVNAR